MRDALRTCSLALLLALPAAAGAQVSVALRTGYAVPRGTAANLGGLGSFDQRDLFGQLVPVQADASWRFSHGLAAGLFASYGLGNPGGQLRSLLCSENSCSRVSDLRLGAQASWSAGRHGPVEPWAGVGFGYEETSFVVHGLTFPTGEPAPAPAYLTDDVRAALRGWASHVEGGADWRLRPDLLAGPFLQVAFGQYRVQDIRFGPPGLVPGNGAIPSTRLHAFLALGVRGRFDL